MSDAINKPAHYNQGPIECIDAMQQILTPEEFRGFLKGNVFKYLWREKGKNGIEDLRKGKDYYDRLIQSFDESESQPVIKQSSTTEPDPEEGYRLLSKDPPEKLLDTDEGLFACGLDGQQWLSVNYSSGEQLPSVYYRRKIDVETLKQFPQLPDGWRFLEVGEVIRKGDQGFEKGLFHAIEPIKIGMTLQAHWMPIIRRNRFEVGEKVVAKDSHEIWEVDSLVNGVYQLRKDQTFFGSYPEHLAPYIEETK